MGTTTDRNTWNEALRLENDQLLMKITILKEEIHLMKSQYQAGSTNNNVP